MKKIRCFDNFSKTERIYLDNQETRNAINLGILRVIEIIENKETFTTEQPEDKPKNKPIHRKK